MLDSLKPGQTITCTITKKPSNHGARATVTRLMQMSPEIKKGLAKAQKRRRDEMRTKPRGGRTWYQRELCSDIAKVQTGQSWSMTYVPHLAPDLRSVEGWVEIKAG